MGITKGKWSTLVTELMAFKELYDHNAPLSRALPDLAAGYSDVYAGWGLRDLCQALHDFNREFEVAKVMREMYVDLPTPVMTPAQAYDHLVRGEIERVDIKALSGRVAGTMLVPYPPGIPTIMPGERFGSSDEPIIQSLRIAREQNARFPGFESDVHGLIIDRSGDTPSYKVEVLKV